MVRLTLSFMLISCAAVSTAEASICTQAALNWYTTYRDHVATGNAPKGPDASSYCPLLPDGSLSQSCVTLIGPTIGNLCFGNENSSAPAECIYSALMYNPGVTSLKRASELCQGAGTSEVAQQRWRCSMDYVVTYYPSWNWNYYSTYNPWLYPTYWPYGGGYGPNIWGSISGVTVVSSGVTSGAFASAYSGYYAGAYSNAGIGSFTGPQSSSAGGSSAAASSAQGSSAGGSSSGGAPAFSSSGAGFISSGGTGSGYVASAAGNSGFSGTTSRRQVRAEIVDETGFDERQATWAYVDLVEYCNPTTVVVQKSGASTLTGILPWLLNVVFGS